MIPTATELRTGRNSPGASVEAGNTSFGAISASGETFATFRRTAVLPRAFTVIRSLGAIPRRCTTISTVEVSSAELSLSFDHSGAGSNRASSLCRRFTGRWYKQLFVDRDVLLPLVHANREAAIRPG